MSRLMRTQLFDTDGILERIFENLNFYKKLAVGKKYAKLPSMQRDIL